MVYSCIAVMRKKGGRNVRTHEKITLLFKRI